MEEGDLKRLFGTLEEDRGGSKGSKDCKERREHDGNHDDNPGLGREETAADEADDGALEAEAELEAAAADLADPKNETSEASSSSDSPSVALNCHTLLPCPPCSKCYECCRLNFDSELTMEETLPGPLPAQQNPSCHLKLLS